MSARRVATVLLLGLLWHEWHEWHVWHEQSGSAAADVHSPAAMEGQSQPRNDDVMRANSKSTRKHSTTSKKKTTTTAPLPNCTGNWTLPVLEVAMVNATNMMRNLAAKEALYSHMRLLKVSPKLAADLTRCSEDAQKGIFQDDCVNSFFVHEMDFNDIGNEMYRLMSLIDIIVLHLQPDSDYTLEAKTKCLQPFKRTILCNATKNTVNKVVLACYCAPSKGSWYRGVLCYDCVGHHCVDYITSPCGGVINRTYICDNIAKASLRPALGWGEVLVTTLLSIILIH